MALQLTYAVDEHKHY